MLGNTYNYQHVCYESTVTQFVYSCCRNVSDKVIIIIIIIIIISTM